MENLDRGVIAVPGRSGGVFVSWRLFGTDRDDVSFNLYRDGSTLVCSTGPDEGTNCVDSGGTTGAGYDVRTVIDGQEGAPSRAYEYTGVNYIRIPLRSASGAIHLAWTGDLDGDGDMDFVVDRIGGTHPLVDAYLNDGTFLWRIDMGPNSEDNNGIEGGASVISNGHWDGLTVYDFDSDGKAEVAIKTAPGLVFGDGGVVPGSGETQYLAIVDGMTGAEITSTPLPTDYVPDGPLQCHFSAGYFDGEYPSIVTRCKNRQDSGAFNLVAAAWDYRGGALTERWKWLRGNTNAPDFHQHRALDVDGDGFDELCDGGYALDQDGTLLYSLGDHGVIHGDRFHITDMDPTRPGLEGFGIQQDNASGLETYYYDAATGEMLREHCCGGGDLGRGTILDLYPEKPGYEYMSFNGMWVAGSGENITSSGDAVPWPNFRMWWDGDLGSEHLDHQWVGEWNTEAMERNTYYWKETFSGLETARGAIPLYGDLYGDWREEAVVESTDQTELRIYSTNYPSDYRIYTMLHNPAYRNALTAKGYLQSHHVDYFLGYDMAAPPRPHIRLVH